MTRTKCHLLKVFLFCAFLLFIIFNLQPVFSLNALRSYRNQCGFYVEKAESLDAVYIGASNVHTFWTPPIAWENHGLAVWSFSTNAIPPTAIKFLLIESRKKQSNSLFIININTLKTTAVREASLHWTVDYLPGSINKLRLINRLTLTGGFTGLARLEFFFPIIRFHSRWSSLSSWIFKSPDDGLKAGVNTDTFKTKVEDITKRYNQPQALSFPTASQYDILSELLDYCDTEKVNTLFVVVPQAVSSETCTKLNAIECIIKQRGYPILNLLKDIEKTGIQTTTDFFNANHTNIHGSLKFTEYLSKYLIEHYNFKDKRGQPGWESWDKSVEQYGRVINPWTLPLEREYAPRDYSLVAPSLNRPRVKDQDIIVSWKAIAGAEGYEIYRKSNSELHGYWHHIKTVGSNTLNYVDCNLKAKTQYTYTVVPFRKENGKTLYGHFSFNGVTATTGGK